MQVAGAFSKPSLPIARRNVGQRVRVLVWENPVANSCVDVLKSLPGCADTRSKCNYALQMQCIGSAPGFQVNTGQSRDEVDELKDRAAVGRWGDYRVMDEQHLMSLILE